MSENDYVFICLHCEEPFVIAKKDFNCKILRHGVMKDTGKPMNPHASQEECIRLVQKGLIYGCGKPLRIKEKEKSSDEFLLEVCDYI